MYVFQVPGRPAVVWTWHKVRAMFDVILAACRRSVGLEDHVSHKALVDLGHFSVKKKSKKSKTEMTASVQ